MKKVFSMVAVAVALLFAGQAQAQISFNAGYANQACTKTGTLPILGTSSSHDTSMVGFFVGASYNIPIAQGLSVAPGIYYQQLSHSTSDVILGSTTHTKDFENALSLPILFNYSIPLSGDFGLYAFVGPTLTYGLDAYSKIWLNDNSDSPLLNAKYYDGDDPVKSRLNVFGTFGVGVKYHALRLQVGYQIGLLDRVNSDNASEKVNNLFFGVGYVL